MALSLMALMNDRAAYAAPPGYVPHSALINGDSVVNFFDDGTGTLVSLEEIAAEEAGFTVTVVNGSTWSGMSAADFAKYQLLIIGDPSCGTIPASATGNSATWGPVVMGTAGGASGTGNRVLVGTDPVFHVGADPGAKDLVKGGIIYAGGVDGSTGVYFDTTCSDNGEALTTLDRLTTDHGKWTENTGPPCGGDVALIADVDEFAGLTTSDIEGWGCSVHTTYPTYPTDWQPLAVATDTPTQPTCGTDPSTGDPACGESYVLVAGEGIVVVSPNLSLTPATASAPAGGTHTVTATVSQAGSPLAGELVEFTITGQNAGVSGTCVPASCESDAAGEVDFTYPDTNGAGTDTINAATTIDSTTEHATASMTWTDVSGPTVNAGPDASGPVGTNLPLNGSSTGTTSTTWSLPAGAPCTIADPSALVTTVSCTDPGNYTLTLSGTDGSTTVTDTMIAHVNPVSTGAKCHGLPATITGTNGDDPITGTPGDDVIVSLAGNDTINGEGGSDTICSGKGDDNVRSRGGDDMFVNAGGGNDTVIGGRGNDTVAGGVGDDTVRGQAGDDTVRGSSGDDHLFGGNGDDHLFGNPGDDDLVGGPGSNVLNGGPGSDTCGGPTDGPNALQSCEA